MARGARFAVGSSGSPKHTETYGSGDGGHVGESGPRIGAGAEGRRVTPTYNKDSDSKQNGVRKTGKVKVYSAGE